MAKKLFPTLYKYTATGKVQEWTIEVESNTFWTVDGLKDGKLTKSAPTVCMGKNIGRANETSPSEQAMREAQSKFQKKLDKGYNEKLTKEKRFFEPMLAKQYDDYSHLCFTVPTFIQPKLDGLRCINSNGTMMSRNGKPFVTVEHLTQDLGVLDGELYSHRYHDDFNKIISLVKKTKPKPSDIKECESIIEFWAYDYPEHHGVFSERYTKLQNLVKTLKNDMIKIVPTFQVTNEEELEKYHIQFINEGYEGSIIRLDLNSYENKRSNQLLKKKDFDDDEFEIVEFLEGIGGRTGTAGKVVCLLDDGTTFEAGMSFDFKQVVDFWNNRNEYVGKLASIRYFGYTPAGKPRFGVCKQIDRTSYE